MGKSDDNNVGYNLKNYKKKNTHTKMLLLLKSEVSMPAILTVYFLQHHGSYSLPVNILNENDFHFK